MSHNVIIDRGTLSAVYALKTLMKKHKSKRSKNLSQKIIDTTLQEIGRNGISNLTTKTISLKANTSTGIIHHHFETKDQLVLSSYTALIREHRQAILEARKQHNDPLKRLQATINLQFDEERFFADDSVRVWPQFWANAMYDSAVQRLLLVYNKRLMNNLYCDLIQLCDSKQQAKIKAHTMIALIHGLWIERFIIKSVSTETCLETIFSCISNPNQPH